MRKTLSVAIITRNEEANLDRTLGSVAWADEIVVVDSGSNDRTEEIARSFRSRFFLEEWKGFAAQKNSALEKCSCDWILSLDADEALSDELAKEIWELLERDPPFDGYALPRRNLFLGRWMRFGGFYPDPKLRLFRRGAAEFEARPVHETLHFPGKAGRLKGDMVHDAYPSLEAYIAHMDRYSTLGAEQVVREGGSRLTWTFAVNVVLNPVGHVCLQLFFSVGISGWAGRVVASLVPLGLRELEVCQGLGAGAQPITGDQPQNLSWRRIVRRVFLSLSPPQIDGCPTSRLCFARCADTTNLDLLSPVKRKDSMVKRCGIPHLAKYKRDRP